MDAVFLTVESTALSTWLRDSPSLWAFPFVLILHTVGLALLVGTGLAVAGRALGLARGVPLTALVPWLRVLWLGFWLNAASGVLLLIAYPTKALTNPLFYAKLALIAAALAALWPLLGRIRRGIEGDVGARLKAAALVSLGCWAASITAGRFLAYTYTRLTVFF